LKRESKAKRNENTNLIMSYKNKEKSNPAEREKIRDLAEGREKNQWKNKESKRKESVKGK